MRSANRRLRIGQVLRYARPYDPEPEVLDGMPNYFHLTHVPGCSLPLLDRGINPVQAVLARDGERRPAILISSSPHRVGSEGTPWQDFFDPDNGHIRYSGDNKTPGRDPASAAGNRLLLDEFQRQHSMDSETRKHATPIVFFRRVARGGRAKGYVEFQGFGVVERAELVVQYDRKNDRSFPNYVFDFVVLSMAAENEQFDWSWIASRREANVTLATTLRLAPASWRSWVKSGPKVVESCRRRVSRLLTRKGREQRPRSDTREAKALQDILTFYQAKRSRFEALAAVVAERILTPRNGRYVTGWVTPPSSDGGADFVGRLEIGSGFSSTKLIVLGQAKCEQPQTPTSGQDIARTVARLKRGWIGIYVTTSHFSEAAQREVIDDDYPIILVPGLRLANEVIAMAHEQGFPDVTSLLGAIDQRYGGMVHSRRPEEILHYTGTDVPGS